jgi:hypothetical protein
MKQKQDIDMVLRLPSGQTVKQVKKDAKRLGAEQPGLSHWEALDQAAALHLAPSGFRDARIEAERFHAYREANFKDSPNPIYCVKCGRQATVLSIMGLPRCGYHADPFCDEASIPEYTGKIPDGAVCAHSGCTSDPTRILGGSCFCELHFQWRKSR